MSTSQELEKYEEFQAASLPPETNENYWSHGTTVGANTWAFSEEGIELSQEEVQEFTKHELSACRLHVSTGERSLVTLENYTADASAWTDHPHKVDCLVLPFLNLETHIPDRARVLKYSASSSPGNTAFGLLFSALKNLLLPADCARVIRRAKEQGLNEVAARLLTLWGEVPDKDEMALDSDAADYFVTFMIRTGATKPIITVDPLGRLDATWSAGEGKRLVMRFFPTEDISVVHKSSAAKGSFSSTLSKITDENFVVNLDYWING